MEEPESPPTAHTLRPHHISLLMVIMLLYRHYPRKRFHPSFLIHVHRVLLEEVVEVIPPRSFPNLLEALKAAPHSDSDGAAPFFESLKPKYMDFVSVDHMTNFFHGLPSRFQGLSRFDKCYRCILPNRRSIFGYFCRRAVVSYMKLSFAGVSRLRLDYHEWLNGSTTAGYKDFQRDLITFGMFHSWNEYRWAEPEAYSDFERGLATGDSNAPQKPCDDSLNNISTKEATRHGMRQHALLNLSRMYYLRREHTAARKFLIEAIEISRLAGDKETLQHCQGLLHRLPPKHENHKPIINEIQPGLHPIEVLFDEQPLSAAFEKIIQAVGLYDHWIDVQGNHLDDAEQWSQHTVQSVVWSAAGCEKLAVIEENVVIAFSEVGGDSNNAIIVTLNGAYRRARQGKYQDAIAILLEPKVWKGLSLNDYSQWASQIWHIITLRASRRLGHYSAFSDDTSMRPAGPFNPRDYFFNATTSTKSIIRDPLYEFLQMKQVGQAATTVEQLLRALWHSEFQCRYASYRTGIILLADVGLEFGMTQRCKRILEEIMPQVIDGDDLEQRALACYTLARCIVAAGERSQKSIREALPYLDIAEKDYATLEILRSLADVQFLISLLYHNLNMVEERDAAATRHLKTEETIKEAAVVVVEDWINQVWELVLDIGAALAKR
ncbi:hypothetical protein B0F90DRAFT_1814283 [Multifurca ochricompacta]|uniref:Anaphase-promoting complex subunit 5 n=1 Tax=Multifurca ochricompacta TaxID=376703 RepID=A0AAD4QP09_9AGAM|nr:hypothetical protein B0F90DRAFT_1814283 [Multifurca ochricompacta]